MNGEDLGLMTHITQGQGFVPACMDKKEYIEQQENPTCSHEPMYMSHGTSVVKEMWREGKKGSWACSGSSVLFSVHDARRLAAALRGKQQVVGQAGTDLAEIAGA